MRWFGVSLGQGNTKIGDVLTFSLPSKTTCPGASAWCLTRCYAYRYEVRRPGCLKAYQSNLALAQDTKRFKKTLIGVLPRIMSCFRLHVSGDLFSKDYCDAWRSICEAFPQTRFWGYTRSWSVEELTESIESLRDLDNVQLFASVDPDMRLPPKGWRVAYINKDPRAQGQPCKKQHNEAESCQHCGYCFKRRTGDVIFNVH